MKRQPEETVLFEGWSELPLELWAPILQNLLYFVDYEEMVSMRLVSKYFLQVMDQEVAPEVPQLRASTLNRAIEYFSPYTRLGKFTGITRLVLDSLSNHVPDYLLDKMTRLSKLKTNGHFRGGNIHFPILYSKIDSLSLESNDGYSCLIQPSQLTSFTRLRYLSLDNYLTIKDLDLLKLTQLETLRLCCASKITDDGLSLLTNLTTLRIKNREKVKVTSSSMSKLTKLEILEIPGYEILKNSLHLLPLVPNLTCLALTGIIAVKDNVLAQLTNLTVLSMRKRNIVFKGEAFLSLTNLKSLRLFCDSNSIVDEKYLATMTQLDDLYLINNDRITNTTLQSLTRLEYLWLDNDNLLTNESLLYKPHLAQLTISGISLINEPHLYLPPHCLIGYPTDQQKEAYFQDSCVARA